jgi:hypothetical protein
MLKELEQLAPDPQIVGACRELPGIVLDRVVVEPMQRDTEDYQAVAREYDRRRTDYLKALVAHPIGRALALLAVGPYGVERMERGYAPDVAIAAERSPTGRLRTTRDRYNCHHVVPKSLRQIERPDRTNHPSNLVVTRTHSRGKDQSRNPHHLWHALLLHPQTHRAPEQPVPIYVVRPLFPFYPPLTEGYRSVNDLRERLKALGAPALPEIWEKRLLEFSKATGHRGYEVPKQFHRITQMFAELFNPETRDSTEHAEARDRLANEAAGIAAEWLPAGATINGKTLPPHHRPKHRLPIISSPAPETPVAPKPRNSPRRRPKAPAQVQRNVSVAV